MEGSMASAYPTPRVAQPTYGRGLLSALPAGVLGRPLICTQEIPWRVVQENFPVGRSKVQMVHTMEQSVLLSQVESCNGCSSIVGVGGGQALDYAKFMAWKTGHPLILVPTILSVDAAFTKSIGIREQGQVRYVGEVYPEHLLIDFEILQSAPKILNRSGAADVLSIFTALWDWREAGKRLGEEHDPSIAQEAQWLLDRLFAAATDLRAVTDHGLRELAELYKGEVLLCEMFGNSRPEEGSEHYFAYCHESLTGRNFVHGQLVGLGVMLAGAYQEQSILQVKEFLTALGLDCRPDGQWTSVDEVRRTLTTLKDYVNREEHLLPGVFHFREAITDKMADHLISLL